MIKQIWNNWKLELILLLGLTLAVGVFSSIPLYSEASLQYGLMNSWESGSSPRNPPGMIRVSNEQWKDYHPVFNPSQWRDQDEAFGEFLALDSMLKEEMPVRFGEELLYFAQVGTIERQWFRPVEEDGWPGRRYADIRYLTGLEDHVTIIEGRWPDPETAYTGDAIEVVIDETARDNLGLFVGRTYLFPLRREPGQVQQFIDVKIVGIYRTDIEAYNKPVWVLNAPFSESFMVSKEVFEELVKRDDLVPYTYEWMWVFDHSTVRVHELPQIVEGLTNLESRMLQLTNNVRFAKTPVNMFNTFISRATVLEQLLLILSLPVLGIVLYYTILVAGLTIRRRRNEIAMLKSRGAGLTQIIVIYALEWGILSVVALAIGPHLGVLISKVMGASAGFLSFVGREPLPVMLNPDAYKYSLIALGLSLVACLFQVIPAARHSIVSYKQDIARGSGTPFWQRYFLDFGLLIVSYYGYRNLETQIASMTAATNTQAQLIVDPMLFLVPVLFLLTAGLLVLRVLPWLIRLLSFVTKRLPDVQWSMTLRQFSRDPGRYSPLMLFIILTVSLGIYGASIARTIDQNYIDSQLYRVGSDVVLTENWVVSSIGGGIDPVTGEAIPDLREIAEPPFYVHKEMPGVIDAARVFKNTIRVGIGNMMMGNGTIMGIDPVDFANVAWYRRDLTDYHLHEYLNRLILYPEAALVDRLFFENFGLQIGDWIVAEINQQKIDFWIAGVVDLWPTVYPREFPLIVGNLDYIQSQYVIEPYNVWLRVEDGAELAPIIKELAEHGVYVTGVNDARTKLIEGRRDPQRMGLFGMLTISFLVSVVITIVGFLLYTFLSLKDRMLQFGVLRAIGLSFGQLIGMLSIEQILSVGVSLGFGTIFGIVVSYVFIPFMQITQDLAGAVPDFLVVVRPGDILQICIVIGVTLLIGIIGLGVVISRMRLHQAIKLGEEV